MIAMPVVGAQGGGEIIQIFQGQGDGGGKGGEFLGNFLDKGGGFVKSGEGGVGTENLLQQGGAAPGMAAEKGETLGFGVGFALLAPAADRVGRKGGEEGAATMVAAVVVLFEARDVGGLAENVFGFAEPAEGFGMPAGCIEEDGELVAARITDVQVLGRALDNIAQEVFGLGVPLETVEEEGLDAGDLGVAGVMGGAGLDAGPSLVEVTFAFIPVGEAEEGVEGSRLCSDGAFEAIAREFKTAKGMELLADEDKHGNVTGREFDRALEGMNGLVEVEEFGGGKTEFEPDAGGIGEFG